MRLPKPRWPGDLDLLSPRDLTDARTWVGRQALREVVRHLGDADLERRVGTPIVLRLIFATMARSYDPEAADGFRGEICFELTRPASGRPASWWTLIVSQDGHAHARPGPADACELAVRLPVGDLLRIAGGLTDPVEPVLGGRARVSGDLGLAARLGEMLGAPQVG